MTDVPRSQLVALVAQWEREAYLLERRGGADGLTDQDRRVTAMNARALRVCARELRNVVDGKGLPSGRG
jgi:hypothetical protein